MGEAQSAGTSNGPSWWDCERAVVDIQYRHDCQVVMQIVPVYAKGRGVTSWTVYAHAHVPKRLAGVPLQTASTSFRGTAGSKTMPAAFFMALLFLGEKLSGHGGQAKLPGF